MTRLFVRAGVIVVRQGEQEVEIDRSLHDTLVAILSGSTGPTSDEITPVPGGVAIKGITIHEDEYPYVLTQLEASRQF